MKKDEYILGINGLGVTPSACLIKNGKLLAMAEEERFNRIKGSFGLMPSKSIKYCLSTANIDSSDLKSIQFAWDCKFYLYKMPLFLLKQLFNRAPIKQEGGNVAKVTKELLKYQSFHVKRLIKKSFKVETISGKLPEIAFVPHHQAHAASSYYCSGFEEAHILVIDGSGENKTTSIWRGKQDKLFKIKEYKIPDSLGWFYQSITEYLGFMPNNHEGKTMALAAYGKADFKIEEAFKKIISFSANGDYSFNPIYSFAGRHSKGTVFSDELEQVLGPARLRHEEITQKHKNIAFEAQKILEKIASYLVKEIVSYPDFKGNLCIAGGVGLNCKMNGELAKLEGIKQIFVPPFSNDAGTALGAAQLASSLLQVEALQHAYWGPEYSNDEIKAALLQSKLSFVFEEDIAFSVAKLLENEKIVGWFQGRLEIGSRALGARSILANPAKTSTRDYINKKIKNREPWRPFAASFLEEKSDKYFPKNLANAFMTLACQLSDTNSNKLAGAVHIDQSTRPQLVSKASNLKYWKLINYFGEMTGNYAVLNTSFNLSEEPIVCTPEQAINSFVKSGLDALAIGDYLILKP
ncbi:MAG: hypothetical protein H6579_05095 [Chitinophagales bacterium]|nr:hypothetical protein [Chitinophagales bacterium]